MFILTLSGSHVLFYSFPTTPSFKIFQRIGLYCTYFFKCSFVELPTCILAVSCDTRRAVFHSFKTFTIWQIVVGGAIFKPSACLEFKAQQTAMSQWVDLMRGQNACWITATCTHRMESKENFILQEENIATLPILFRYGLFRYSQSHC